MMSAITVAGAHEHKLLEITLVFKSHNAIRDCEKVLPMSALTGSVLLSMLCLIRFTASASLSRKAMSVPLFGFFFFALALSLAYAVRSVYRNPYIDASIR
jgi:hypothetical protein